jgi:hypothetical protein
MSSGDGWECLGFVSLKGFGQMMMFADVGVCPGPNFGAFAGRNREGESGARIAFDVASGPLGVVARVLG